MYIKQLIKIADIVITIPLSVLCQPTTSITYGGHKTRVRFKLPAMKSLGSPNERSVKAMTGTIKPNIALIRTTCFVFKCSSPQ